MGRRPAHGRASREVTAQLAAAREAYAALAPRLAARGRVRISSDGRNYPAKRERDVSPVLPKQPSAVLLYDDAGLLPVFVVDLDSSKHGVSQVDVDHELLAGLLDETGCSWFSDHSPNGGRHVYIPLATALAFHDVQPIAVAMCERLPSMDRQPLAGLVQGCLRPPGAWHSTGGHQVLDQPLSHAIAALDAPSSPQAWARFVSSFPSPAIPQGEPAPRLATPRLGTVDAPVRHSDEGARLPALRGYTEPDARFQQIARTGEYEPTAYASPSEARQAVLWAAAASGWSLTDVVTRLEDGTWRGLAAMYAKYRTRARQALAREWHRAQAFERARREHRGHTPTARHRSSSAPGTETTSAESVRGSLTSRSKTRRGRAQGPLAGGSARPVAGSRSEVREWVAAWTVACDFIYAKQDGQEGANPALRAVLRVLGQIAVQTNSLVVDHGQRACAIAAGVDDSTVGRYLRELREEPSDRAVIQLVEPARGVKAHAYELRIPPLLRAACERQAQTRRGAMHHGIRPAFRELGLVAAFVYEALEHHHRNGTGPLDGRTLATDARLGKTATYNALQDLAAWGLADRVPGGWQLGTASPARVAEAFGVDEAVRAQITRYRAERIAWWHWLADRGLLDSSRLDQIRPRPAPPPEQQPPPPDDTSLLDLLHRELGAVTIAS